MATLEAGNNIASLLQTNQELRSIIVKLWIGNAEYEIIPVDINVKHVIDFSGYPQEHISIKGYSIAKPAVSITVPMQAEPEIITPISKPVIESRDW